MQATSVDLRFKTKEIFEALQRGESVELLQRGKIKGRIVPAAQKKKMKAEDHPLFGMEKESLKSVEELMNELRRDRNHDL